MNMFTTREAPLEEVQQSEFDYGFTGHMLNAMCMSYYKYGHINNYVGCKALDYIDAELKAFTKDHNTEHMVNIANYAMIRYMFPQGTEKYEATDSDKSAKPKVQSVFEHIRDHIMEYL